ncbi:MAG TPA: hypothetical protein VJ821_11045 [Anaerolineales bacterium]|nr:hypothetical protein [Anaerolineales bacterium]
MNLNFLREIRENRMALQALFVGLFFIGLILLVNALTSRETVDTAQLQRDADSTRTAVALTSDALLGPFPTSTAPTATITVTARPSITPTTTPTETVTSSPTPILLFTWTPRTSVPRATFTSTPRPTRTRTPVPPRPTSTRVPPTRTPPPPPTTYP